MYPGTSKNKAQTLTKSTYHVFVPLSGFYELHSVYCPTCTHISVFETSTTKTKHVSSASSKKFSSLSKKSTTPIKNLCSINKTIKKQTPRRIAPKSAIKTDDALCMLAHEAVVRLQQTIPRHVICPVGIKTVFTKAFGTPQTTNSISPSSHSAFSTFNAKFAKSHHAQKATRN